MRRGAYLPVREYADADEMLRHAAEVRARMFAPRLAPVLHVVEPAPAPEPEPVVDEFVERTVAEHGPTLVAESSQQREGRAELRGADALKLACDVTGFAAADLRGERRIPVLVKARHIAMWLMTVKAGKSTLETGRALGGRDHTTVMHARRRVEGAMRSLSIQPTLEAAEIAAALWASEWPRTDYRRKTAAEQRR